MRIDTAIALMVDRLHRANIPINNLCYECDEKEWAELQKIVSCAVFKTSEAPNDMRNVRYMGLHIRPRE